MTFPQRFARGCVTASYPIEGAPLEDGKGLSIWDVFAHQPGKTAGGDTGDVACVHYHRWPEDVAAAREATFSISPSIHFNHTWFGDPMILGCYPERILERFGKQWPAIASGDVETICQPLDFYGVNVYFNGTANPNWPHLDGRVHDPQRIDFLARYLLQVKRALDEGIETALKPTPGASNADMACQICSHRPREAGGHDPGNGPKEAI
jgi:beta-glucosidase/6-phospho-beta-glucosidase/beta-galactosidase